MTPLDTHNFFKVEAVGVYSVGTVLPSTEDRSLTVIWGRGGNEPPWCTPARLLFQVVRLVAGSRGLITVI